MPLFEMPNAYPTPYDEAVKQCEERLKFLKSMQRKCIEDGKKSDERFKEAMKGVFTNALRNH